MDSRHGVLHLSLIKNVGPALGQRVVNTLGFSNLSEMYHYTHADFMQAVGMTSVQAQVLVEGLSNKDILLKELALIEKHHISWGTCFDEAYPVLLKEIYLPPLVIYYQSIHNFPKCDALAIVGSRQAKLYAKRVIESIVPALVAHTWMIVSGGAWGADSLAHAATVQAKGTTTAVLGSGLLRPYPAANKKLFDHIVASGGFLMSCFPLEHEALPGNFPARNRIISGLSRGVLVVQAAERSGAKITAHFALEHGREVFAIPGTIDDPLSVGCHQLIQQGAKLVWCVEDILSEFGMTTRVQEPVLKIENSISQHKEHEGTSLQAQILRFCEQPTSVDYMVAQIDKELSHVQAALFELQLDGKLVQNSVGLWIRT